MKIISIESNEGFKIKFSSYMQNVVLLPNTQHLKSKHLHAYTLHAVYGLTIAMNCFSL